jgi:DNA-binding NtrC family response regulator
LANTIERAAILEESALIELQHVVLPDLKKIPPPSGNAPSPRPAESLADKEKETILSALEECLWIQKDAARKLGITPRALNYKVKKFNITHARWRKNK